MKNDKFTDKIKNLKERINEYIKQGGDIYAGKRELPYYEYLHTLKRRMEEYYNSKFSVEYMYSLCGITFDREYNNHKSVCDRLALYADKKGCVDVVRTDEVKAKDTVYTDLKNLSAKHNASMLDYLVLDVWWVIALKNLKKIY